MMRLSEYEERRQWKMIRWMGAKQLKRERERLVGGKGVPSMWKMDMIPPFKIESEEFTIILLHIWAFIRCMSLTADLM